MSPVPTFQPADLLQARTVLAIQPHYDDNDLGAGGTLAAMSRGGARLIYVTVTDDQVGVTDPWLPPDATEAALRREQDEAGQAIGVHEQRRLGHPDAGPIDAFVLRQGLIELIRELEPDVIFTVDPWLPYEFHPDHVVTGRAVSEAAGLYGFARLPIGGRLAPGYRPHALRGIAYYFTHAPNAYIDITGTREAKHRAVRAYRMQFSETEMDALLNELQEQEQEAARGRGFEFGEALKLLHPAQLHIHTDTWRR